MAEIEMMPVRVDAGDVCGRIAAAGGFGDAAVERCVYYPYYHYQATGRFRWLFGMRDVDFDCVVDARNGRAASADSLSVERVTVRDGDCLRSVTAEPDAARSARRYAAHALGKALRMLGDFNLSLVTRGVIHRPFWVVRVASQRMLVDSVTGEYYPLPGGNDTALEGETS